MKYMTLRSTLQNFSELGSENVIFVTNAFKIWHAQIGPTKDLNFSSSSKRRFARYELVRSGNRLSDVQECFL